MADRVYLPLMQYLQQLVPANLIDLPEVEELEHLWLEAPQIDDGPFRLHTALLLETELGLGIPGLDAVRLVLGAEGEQTSFVLEVIADPVPTIRLVELPVVLRFDQDLLKPVRRPADAGGADRWEVDPDRDHVDVTLAKVTLAVDMDGNVQFDTDLSIDLPPSMIGDTGVVVEAQAVQIYLGAGTPPAGRPNGWRGVHIAHAGLSLPGDLAGIVGHLELIDASIGNGGFSGTVSDTWTPALSASLFGLELGLSRVAVTFVQNTLAECDIRGSILLPFFEERVDVELGFDLDGGVSVALSAEDGLITLSRPGLLELTVDGLGFEVADGVLTVSVSGDLTPDLAGIDWPTFGVKELSIDTEGHVRLDGGWLDLPEQYALEFYGFRLEITQLGFGRGTDGGKWVGFSGALKLVEGLPAGASVDGLRVHWYDDGSGRPVRLSLDGVGVEFEVPDVLRFKGAISYRELPGDIRRFDGAISLDLTVIGLEIDAALVIGSAPGYTFFAIHIGVELPVGIPLGATGLGLFGMAGLFAYQMEPDRRPDEKWYGVGPTDGWYKRGTIGVTDLKAKWRPQAGSLALGAGVTLGTVSDNGFTFAGKVLFVIVFPGPIIMIEGKANLLKERATLSDEPLFRKLAVLDFRNGFVQIGLDVDYQYADEGELLDIAGGVEAFFDFHDANAWHLYLGEKTPPERRIRSQIFQLLEANAYFMLDPRRLQQGARIGYAAHWEFGPLDVTLEAWLEGDADLSFKPPHFLGGLWLHGKVGLSVFGFGLALEVAARATADVFDPFHIVFDMHVSIDLPWFLPDFGADATLEWGPDPTPPILPLPLKEIAVEHVKVTTTWPLPRGGTSPLLRPDYDTDADGFLDPVAGTSEPADLTAVPVVPLDGRPHVSFGRAVHDDAGVGVNPQPVLPSAQPAGWEWFGDPARNEGPVRARYAVASIALERRGGTTWQPVAAAPAQPGVPTLYGSWAPVPQLPAGIAAPGSSPPVANAVLWLWSRTPFDWSRHSSGAWDEWFGDTFTGYPCPPDPPGVTACCDVEGLPLGAVVLSPWSCPHRPGLTLSWTALAVGVVTALTPPVDGHTRAICLPGSVRTAAGDTVDVVITVGVPGGANQVEIHLGHPPDTRPVRRCVDFAAEPAGPGPNPRQVGGIGFAVLEWVGQPAAETRITGVAGRQALDCGSRLEAVLPAADQVDVTLVHFADPPTVEVFDAAGNRTAVRTAKNPAGQPEQLTLPGPGITRVVVTASNREALLLELCTTAPPLVITGHTGDGTVVPGSLGTAGTVTVTAPGLVSVDVSAPGGLCLTGVCATFPPDPAEVARHTAMTRHLVDELARWSQAGEVLEPDTTYRVTVVTTLEVQGFAPDPAFNGIRTQTEHAYFRTEGPPALAQLAVPVNTPDSANYASGVDDLTAYVQQTVPETVPAPGERPLLPRPVYRAYDVGVRFNEDYVDLMYRIDGRDLGLYLADNSEQPVRDVAGWLVVPDNAWGRAEERTARASEQRWESMVNAGGCATLDLSGAPRDRTLVAGGGMVLAPDTVYQARLVPLLAHLDGARGLAGWEAPVDQGTGGPSRWAARQHPTMSGGAATAAGTRLTLDGTGALDALDPAFDVVLLAADTGRPSRRYRVVAVDAVARALTLDAAPQLPAGGSAWEIPRLGAFVQTAPIAATAAGNDPVQPGTMLLTGDPVGWTDYRLQVWVRSSIGGAIGVVVRAAAGDSYYRFSMDRLRRYRRLVRVVGGVHTVLAEDDQVYATDTDYLVAIEAAGDTLRVAVAGEPLFDVRDAALPAGRAGLYTSRETMARFTDVRVDDLRADAPVAYRFGFTTSAFATFAHHLHGYQDETWRPAVSAAAVTAAATSAVDPASPPGEPEQRAFETLASAALSKGAATPARRTEVSRLGGGGLLVRSPEPVDWRRTGVRLSRADGPLRPVEPPGPVKLVGASAAEIDPDGETVDLMLRDPADLTGWSVERHTLPGAVRESGWDEVLDLDRFTGVAHGALLRAGFGPNALDRFTIVDEEAPGLIAGSAWSVVDGVIVQSGNYMGGGSTEAGVEKPGTIALTGEDWTDVRITAGLRSDDQDDIGLVFRWRDEHHHYRFSMSRYGGYRRLVRRDGATTIVLWQDGALHPLGVSEELTLETWGDRLVGWLDRRLLFSVRDGDVGGTAGRVGFYCWRNQAARFESLTVEALERPPVAWQPAFTEVREVAAFDDSPTVFGPSAWSASGGVLRQTSSIGQPAGPPTPLDPGTFAVGGDDRWTDVRISVRLRIDAGGPIGVLFRYLDGDRHYRFSVCAARSYRRLVRREGTQVVVLWEDQGPVPMNATVELTLCADGDLLTGMLDGVPLFTVNDPVHARGRVALYCADNPAAAFERLVVVDRTRRVGGWVVRDDGTSGRPSTWRLGGGVLVQDAPVGGAGDGSGTSVVRGDAGWTDYRASARLRADDPNAVGLMVRHTDGANYYLLRLDRQRDERRLVACVGGVVTTLWTAAGGFPLGTPFEVTVEAVGPRLRGYLGRTRLFEVLDRSHPAGRVGLWCRDSTGARFERVTVRRPPLEAVALFADRFAETGTAGWTVVDSGTAGGPSTWTVQQGELQQTSPIHSPPDPADPDGVAALGTRLLAGDPAWRDVVATVRLRSPSGAPVGLTFGDGGGDTYYRLSMSDTDGYRRLVRFETGAADVLWENAAGYDPGHPHDLAVVVRGGRLRGYLDGLPMFAVRAPARPGRVGVYCAGNTAGGFSGVRVYPADTAEHPWLLDDRFAAHRTPRLTVVDVGDVDGPSAWGADGEGLLQTGSIAGGSADPADPAKPGTLALLGEGVADLRLSVALATGGPGAVGAVFRYTDAGNHYRFSMDGDLGYRRLVRVQGGVSTVLWEDGVAPAVGATTC